MKQYNYDVCVIGGAGHVGAPLAIVLADRGMRTLICDINEEAMDILSKGEMPFTEEGGKTMLRGVLDRKVLGFTPNIKDISNIPVLILTIGTPIDEFHNPVFSLLTRCIDSMIPFLSDEQTIILRSTVAPGATEYLDRYLKSLGKKTRIAFCPERVVQGKAIEEIQTLPQIISGTTPAAVRIAGDIFRRIAPEIVEATPKEAEFAKLICNAYRYIQFAATNQLYMMVESAGLNYNELLLKMKTGYPRMESIPGPGFAAGPCLMKDTMQLFAFEKQNFILGQVAMTINEGLPNFIVERLSRKYDLSQKRIGILGMAFKAESDDIRDSLSYKLGKILRFMGATIHYSDEYVKDTTFISKEELVRQSDIVIIGVPHNAYKTFLFPDAVEVIDMWNMPNTKKI
ncbi:MAG TPA: nucleotide sugar dehydrogenase [Syntrophus sp. (in: bacteria)]|jgi:UDP-N-acetyl-D-mannosaminuronic acid dehydrogenase|nr:nucleotide sugar dehydrogenase [Syntrophus sp. (in: bacteria)]